MSLSFTKTSLSVSPHSIRASHSRTFAWSGPARTPCNRPMRLHGARLPDVNCSFIEGAEGVSDDGMSPPVNDALPSSRQSASRPCSSSSNSRRAALQMVALIAVNGLAGPLSLASPPAAGAEEMSWEEFEALPESMYKSCSPWGMVCIVAGNTYIPLGLPSILGSLALFLPAIWLFVGKDKAERRAAVLEQELGEVRERLQRLEQAKGQK